MQVSNEALLTYLANAVASSSADMDTADEIFIQYINERYKPTSHMKEGNLKILRNKYLDKIEHINLNRST